MFGVPCQYPSGDIGGQLDPTSGAQERAGHHPAVDMGRWGQGAWGGAVDELNWGGGREG